MMQLALVVALLPALALGATEGAGWGPGNGRRPGAAASEELGQPDRMQKRMRLALTLGLAEALDLDEAATMRVRDLVAKDSGKRAPVRQQARESFRVVRAAARGDAAAMAQLDGALGKLREARTQLRSLDDELFQQLTQGLPPDKKAKAALFLGRFRERARHAADGGGPGMHGGPGSGPGRMEGGGPGARQRRGRGDDEPRGPTGRGERRDQHPMAAGSGSGDPDPGHWFTDE